LGRVRPCVKKLTIRYYGMIWIQEHNTVNAEMHKLLAFSQSYSDVGNKIIISSKLIYYPVPNWEANVYSEYLSGFVHCTTPHRSATGANAL